MPVPGMLMQEITEAQPCLAAWSAVAPGHGFPMCSLFLEELGSRRLLVSSYFTVLSWCQFPTLVISSIILGFVCLLFNLKKKKKSLKNVHIQFVNGYSLDNLPEKFSEVLLWLSLETVNVS